MSSKIPRIDAHQHFWDPARGDYGWLTPATGTLFRAYGPEELEPLLRGSCFDGTVLVQAAPTVAETEYLLAIAARTPLVKGVVGWVNFVDEREAATLERLAQSAALKGKPPLKGLRPMIQDLPDPDWMLREEVQWAYRALVQHDLAFDALLYPQHIDRLRRLLDRYPDLRTVIDHGAKPIIRERAFDNWARDIERVARETKVFCKLSGLVTEAKVDWATEDLKPYIDHLLACFGPQRLIFGSDWPVCTLASSYVRWVAAAESLTAHLGAEDRAAIFGGNAVRFYRL